MSERHEGQEGDEPGAPAGPSPDEPMLWALRPDFALEVQQTCALITEDLLALEAPAAPGPQTAAHRERALRLLHALRGSAAMLGAPVLSALAHTLEAQLRSQPTPVPRAAGDALLHGLEGLLSEAQAWAAGVPAPLPPHAPSAQAGATTALPGAAPAAAEGLPGAAALAARLWALQARLEAGAEALSQASAGLGGAGLDPALHARLHEGLRALSEGSAQARALAAVLLAPATRAPTSGSGEGA